MKLLLRAAVMLAALAICAFVVAQVLAAVTVVPWRELWRAELVRTWNIIGGAFAILSLIAWTTFLIVRARRRAA